ncbi:MAG: 50S ribosomal protein L32 [Deltaproteobacteria bacterium]|nr:50S ribosomal protein L32 [Deltaproteobacteria bacterium]
MAVPKRKTSRRIGRMRRSQWLKVARPAATKCPQCGAPKLPHRACGSCGMYKGRAVVKIGNEE